MTEEKIRKLSGRCHCGRVHYEAELDLAGSFRCNCTICTKVGATIATVPPSAFRLLSGDEDLKTYRFGPERLTRFFCAHCGIHCFARARTDGDEFVGVNLNTLEDVELATLPVVYFDGRHDRFDPMPTPQPIHAAAPS